MGGGQVPGKFKLPWRAPDHGEGGEVYGGHHDGDDEPQHPIGALRRVDEEHDGSEKDLLRVV